jgi:hypothetical protein
MNLIPDNVTTLDGNPLLGRLEGGYWLEVIRHLQLQMREDFNEYKFLFHSLQTHTKPDIAEYADSNAVLIVLGDNSGEHFAKHFENFRVVFKVHLADSLEHVHPVPLGYTNMHLHGSTESVIDRPRNVFYSGNINAHRVDLWRALYFKHTWPKPNIRSRLIRRGIVYGVRKMNLANSFHQVFEDSYVNFTSGFAAGLVADEYTRYLAESKISLSPFGFGRAECFRHYESMRSGCIVISDRLPETWYFKGSPIIQIPQWSSLREVIHSLLSDEKKIQRLQEETLGWWNDVCAPPAVARYIAGKIATSIPPKERLAALTSSQIIVKAHQQYQ